MNEKGRKLPKLLLCRSCCCCCCAVNCNKRSKNGGPLTPVEETRSEYSLSTLAAKGKRAEANADEDDDEHRNENHQTQAFKRPFSKSTSELHQPSERADDQSPPFNERRRGGFGSTGSGRLRRSTRPGRSRLAFISTLKNMLGPNRNKEKKKLINGGRSDSQPDPREWPSDGSVDRQDSMAGYGGDTSSAEQSSSATPFSSPRHVSSFLSPNTHCHTDQQTTQGHDHCEEKDDLLIPIEDIDSGSRGTYQGDAKNCSEYPFSSDGELKSCAIDVQEPVTQNIRTLRQYSFFQLEVHLKRGEDLVPRDSCGTSDPYVKFKVAGKMVFKSKTVYKDLNPVWDETFSVGIEDPFDPVHIKVFDYDWGLQDDFMGMASIDLTTLELNKPTDMAVTLKESGKHEYMGTVSLTLTLLPKTQEEKELYLARGGSRLQEQQRRLKSQIWTSVVTIILVEGKELPTMDAEFSEHYVKFRLGNEKSKSKTSSKNLNPRWLEQFDLHLFEEQSPLLEISLWDKDRSRDEFIGRCVLDMREYEKETTHQVWADLDGAGEFTGMRVGSLFILLSISGTTSTTSISDLITYRDEPGEMKSAAEKYRMVRFFENVKDVGCLTVKVYKSQGLAAADFGVGKSDPFCVLELVNARLQTQTEYKTLSPSWNKIFTFDVKDIHSALEVTVYDEDRDHKVDFLGKTVIPLLRIRNGEKKWYALKDKKLRMRAKGNFPEILLECSVYWNPLRGAINTFNPREEKYMQTETKFKRQILIRNVNRIKSFIMDGIEVGMFIKSCFEWESPLRSMVAFISFMLITYYVEVYMVAIGLLLIFLKNYIVISLVGHRYVKDEETDTSVNEDDDDDELKDKEEKKSLKEKLMAVQEVIASVQNAIGFIASLGESVKNTFNFTVPYLSWLMVLVLLVATTILYLIPIRFLVMMWGVVKFSRKLVRPHTIVNNEILDFLSRVPDDEQLRDCHELKTTVGVLENRMRGREGKKKKL